MSKVKVILSSEDELLVELVIEDEKLDKDKLFAAIVQMIERNFGVEYD